MTRHETDELTLMPTDYAAGSPDHPEWSRMAALSDSSTDFACLAISSPFTPMSLIAESTAETIFISTSVFKSAKSTHALLCWIMPQSEKFVGLILTSFAQQKHVAVFSANHVYTSWIVFTDAKKQTYCNLEDPQPSDALFLRPVFQNLSINRKYRVQWLCKL